MLSGRVAKADADFLHPELPAILRRQQWSSLLGPSLKVANHVRVTVDSLVRETVERNFLRDST